MWTERIAVLLRRAVAWWIDAFAVAAVLVMLRGLINLMFSEPLTGQAAETYNVVGLGLGFFAYRVVVEGRYRTSLGKWSLGLQVYEGARGHTGAAIRNSWVLLTMLAAIGPAILDELIIGLVALSVLLLGRHPGDFATQARVDRRLDPFDPMEEV